MEQTFKIFGAYEWYKRDKEKNKNTPVVLKGLVAQVKGRVEKQLEGVSLKIQYNRLRATAGSFLLDGIVDRIENSDAVIFDITGFNPNVMFELGVAMQAARSTNGAKVYVICEGKEFDRNKIPSDLDGYFVSFYEISKEGPVFHDGNSLAMRLVSEVARKYNAAYTEDEE